MRHLTILIAVLTLTTTGASAQSVLERVLGQIDGASNLAQVNGTFANIAESVGIPERNSVVSTPEEREIVRLLSEGDVILVNADLGTGFQEFLVSVDENGDLLFADDTVGTSGGSFASGFLGLFASPLFEGPNGELTVRPGNLGFVAAANSLEFSDVSGFSEFTLSKTTATGTTLVPGDVVLVNIGPGDDILLIVSLEGTAAFADNTLSQAGEIVVGPGFFTLGVPLLESPDGTLTVSSDTLGAPLSNVTNFSTFVPLEATVPITNIIPGLSTTIDGSITNIITGVTSATTEAAVGVATATEFTFPTIDLGDIATTALGAVNTGDITLGVNSAVDEASTSTTNAIAAAMTQIGGSADTGVLVLNVASNASAVQGSIQNTLLAVNGSVGDVSTTALGAVNTGTIISGVNATVQGVVGMSGQNMSGL